MKLENDRFAVRTPRLDETGPTTDPAPPAAVRAPQAQAGVDQFSLSSDAQAVQSAIGQAAAMPEIRHDLVDRMRGLIDRGELGQDPNRLADAIIDRWLVP